ncbi:acyl--CoA ligase [Streptomyces bryophytorum]|uniref:Acyl-coenzyme A synthetase/AMP-(Fatty) acid ligase n=2 Tax=Actinacidiphila bryophytorum TaxID=1436133 RepID=A0A9W4H1A8_9ACTN|nr:acyl--CoA ligase [Actinacidiphila bryophytorum]MBN6544869.1 acyl--CoA ligase [Actinacidiphila bryophytorum]CAG7641474.1 Acyl-coenzyme A synthetase/AMP-(Fatty) acid ligase [Actinacidiphila bryophytorum]
MMGFMVDRAISKHGLQLGSMPEMAAAKNSATQLSLDHDLHVLPDAGRRLTVGRLAEHVDDLAGRLAAAGVRSGDTIAIYKSPNFDVWMLASAAARVGAVPVMLQPALDGATVGILLGRLHRPHLLTDLPKLHVLADVPVMELAKTVIVSHGEWPGAVALTDLAGSPRVEPVFRGLDEPAMITHTSGTTGVPKLVVHTPRTMGVRLRPQWWLLSLMWRRDTVAINLPFVHSRMYAAMSLVLMKAMPVLLMNNPKPDDVAGMLAAHKPTFIEALPNAFMDWEPLADDPRKPFASVKYFSSTFDAIHPRTITRLISASKRRVPLFFQIYGQSEVGPAVGRPYFSKSVHRTDGRCVGYPMPGCAQIRVVSRNGKRPSKANPGSIEVRWDGIAHSYFGEPERYEANKHDGWWRTGDVGYRTRRGCLHMLDREVDMVPETSSTLEIEDLMISRLDELTELVVVIGPNAEPIPVICTDGDRPLDMERWRTAAADFPQLADPVQLPQSELPRTATMKVRRIELSQLLQSRATGGHVA